MPLMSLVTFAGLSISDADFWAGLLLISAPAIIITVCAIAIGRGRELMFGVLLIVAVVLCVGAFKG